MGGKEKSCCFTGHRPDKLPWGYNENSLECLKLKQTLAAEIETLVDKGVTTFYTGMAQGVDLWAALCVLESKKIHSGIKLIAAIPFVGQADRWPPQYKEFYSDILAQTDDSIVFQQHYTKSCMFERNRYMVDNSEYMIAVYNGEKSGGTKYTVDYAIAKGLMVALIDPHCLLVTRK